MVFIGLLKRLLIVEGYMDAISLYQRGIINVVASLGTALTDSQGRLLRRNTEQVILGYDADGAGQQAIIRGMEILKSMDVDIRVLQISGAKDPDEYVLKYGVDKMLKAMDNAISVVEFKIKALKANLDLSNVNDKIKFLTKIAKILANVKSDIEREIYIDKISKVYDISKNAIESEIDKLIYKSDFNNDNNSIPVKKVVNLKNVDNDDKIDVVIKKREGMVIYILINYPEKALEKFKNCIKVDLMKSKKNKRILEILYNKLDINNLPDNMISLFEDDNDINYISGILSYDFGIVDEDKAIEDIEKIYQKEMAISKRNKLILMLENKDQYSESERIEMESELSSIILEIMKMK